jgi:hypothetical protein
MMIVAVLKRNNVVANLKRLSGVFKENPFIRKDCKVGTR